LLTRNLIRNLAWAPHLLGRASAKEEARAAVGIKHISLAIRIDFSHSLIWVGAINCFDGLEIRSASADQRLANPCREVPMHG